ncbi:hypothetical protein B0H65DRAFT_96643 [Neurospora tetraspora]|uniref:Uncharacterized protein n=1 Tax=Neurospora tetraspora TaxID=94610 RepID=A0AAE0JK28_9PEZI|nr:hypothetical protein B0H65DRAFT_96643 [Neurospora tetraspora]
MESLIKNPMFPYNKHSSKDSAGKIPWKPGGLRRFPWFGIIPLVFCICCTGIAIGVVLESDGGLEKDWSGLKQPGVLLAYTSTLANALMGLAFAQAAVIFFWVQATTPVPISSLHHNWAGSSSTMGAIKSIFQGKAIRVSSVSILVTITALLRGPLIQRSSSVQVINVSQNGTIDLPITVNISNFWAGKMSTLDDSDDGQFSPGFSDVIRDFLDKAPLRIPGARCENCTLTIKAFGFDVINCTEISPNTDKYDLDPKHLPKKHQEGTPYGKIPMFQSSVTPTINYNLSEDDLWSVRWMFQVTTRRKANTGCTGAYLNHTCFLNPSAMLYDLSLQGEIATLQSKSWKNDSFVEPLVMINQVFINYQDVKAGNNWLPLSQVGTSLFNSTSWLKYYDRESYRTYNEGLIANLYAANWSSTDYNEPCYQYFNDPMDYIINSYREIAFRMSIRSAADPIYDLTGEITGELGKQLPPIMQKGVPYTRHATQVHYVANIPALILAVIVSLAGPLATLLLFGGWWRLGRDFTMSPLEIANAVLQSGRSKSESSGDDRPTSIDGSAGDDTSIQDEAPAARTQMSYNSIRNGDEPQLQGQSLAHVFAGCSGNASADELAKHFRHRGRTKNPNDGDEEEEPKVQYGVVESQTGDCLAFTVVTGSQGAAVRRPWKGETL